MHRKVAAALLAVLALGVASCGSSETTVTRAQLASRIQTACRTGAAEARKQIDRASRAAQRSGAALMEAIATYQRYMLGRVEHVKVSDASAQNQLNAFKQASKDRLALVERARSAGGSTQRAIIAVQRQAEQAGKQITTAARSLGVQGCI